MGLQGLADIKVSDFIIEYDGSENPKGIVNLDVYNYTTKGEFAGLYIEILDYAVKVAQREKKNEEKFSFKEYLDELTSFGSGVNIEVFNTSISVGSSGAGLEVVTRYETNGTATESLVTFDWLDSLSFAHTKIDAPKENQNAKGTKYEAEINSAAVFVAGEQMVGLSFRGAKELIKLIGRTKLGKKLIPGLIY